MLKEAKARYENGRLVMADGSEPPPEGSEVIVVYHTDPPALPGDSHGDEIYGSWAGKFPADFDIDEALGGIRSGWKRRLGDERG